MSGRRMKALRRAAYGEQASNAAARQYDAPTRELLGKVVGRVGAAKQAVLIGYRRVRLVGMGLTIRVRGAEELRYRAAKRALLRRRLGGRLPS